jgi:osmotically-inducible protein OsmY
VATIAHVDSDLERLVRLALATTAGVDFCALSVVAMNGRVRLCGEARSYAEKCRAAEVAASVSGVREVINQVRVTPG